MKFSGWDYLDHMLIACEELFVCMQGVNYEFLKKKQEEQGSV